MNTDNQVIIKPSKEFVEKLKTYVSKRDNEDEVSKKIRIYLTNLGEKLEDKYI